ncbi:MAG: hypothetical protein ACTSP4_12800 [Candidatus Hodarchaeales archaeon]
MITPTTCSSTTTDSIVFKGTLIVLSGNTLKIGFQLMLYRIALEKMIGEEVTTCIYYSESDKLIPVNLDK